jgi:hypothetical protein
MLTVSAEDIVDERWILVIALDSTEALDLAYNLNTGDRGAVLNLYRFNKGKYDNPDHNHGLDQETLGPLLPFLWFSSNSPSWPVVGVMTQPFPFLVSPYFSV